MVVGLGKSWDGRIRYVNQNNKNAETAESDNMRAAASTDIFCFGYGIGVKVNLVKMSISLHAKTDYGNCNKTIQLPVNYTRKKGFSIN